MAHIGRKSQYPPERLVAVLDSTEQQQVLQYFQPNSKDRYRLEQLFKGEYAAYIDTLNKQFTNRGAPYRAYVAYEELAECFKGQQYTVGRRYLFRVLEEDDVAKAS